MILLLEFITVLIIFQKIMKSKKDYFSMTKIKKMLLENDGEYGMNSLAELKKFITIYSILSKQKRRPQ